MTWILPKQLHTLACALDTEALSLDSNEQSQVCAQSLFVRSKPSQLRIWSAKWRRDSWTRHLSGRILRPSLGNRFAAEWTSSLGATHASPSVQQVSAKESKTRGTCGRGLQMVFDFSDLGSVSLRTSKDISAWGCPTSSKTWQEWVIERRGAYSVRLNAERRTNASGCSSWPTISVNESKNSIGGSQIGRNSIPLGTMAAMHGPAVPASSSTLGSLPESWATPRAGKTTDENPETWAKRQAKGDVATMPLTAQVKTWQTATVSTGAHRQKDGSMTDKLDQQVKRSWPTPSADGDSRPGANADPVKWQQIADAKKAQGINKQLFLTTKVAMESSGKLNPRWVETLMGLPVGWTMPSCASPVTIERMSSDSSATASSQQQQNEPSEH